MTNWASVPTVTVKVRKAHDLYRRGHTYTRLWDGTTGSLIVKGYVELIGEVPSTPVPVAPILEESGSKMGVGLANPRRARAKPKTGPIPGGDQLAAES